MSFEEKLMVIDQLKKQIAAHGPMDADVQKRINYKFRLEWNYNSNIMEGNSLTKQETRSVMVGNITVGGKPLKDMLEIKGHDEVVKDIMKIGAGELNISEARIKEIHKGIMYEEAPEDQKKIGLWKTQNNYLYNYRKERVDFVPFGEVKECMHLLINWLNAEKDKIIRGDKDIMHPVAMAFKFHLDYITIHPFYDGNGRTARIFTNLILIAYGYPPLYIKLDEKDRYYQYLADVQEYGGAPDLFYDFMADMLIRSLQIVLVGISGKPIEEPDDIDKEITMWKKEISSKWVHNQHRDNEVVYELYRMSIKNLFSLFEDKHKQFYDLFGKMQIGHNINNNSRTTHEFDAFDWLDKQMVGIRWKHETDFIKPEEAHKVKPKPDTFQNIYSQIILREYKYNLNNPFNIISKLEFDLQPHTYFIQHNSNVLLEKSYDKQVTDEEAQKIVSDAVKAVFNEIKRKTGG